MRTVQIHSPVVVSHPVSQQFVTLARGMEFPDDDPIVAEFGWAFEEQPPAGPVDSVRVEQATRAPGERRKYTRR